MVGVGAAVGRLFANRSGSAVHIAAALAMTHVAPAMAEEPQAVADESSIDAKVKTLLAQVCCLPRHAIRTPGRLPGPKHFVSYGAAAKSTDAAALALNADIDREMNLIDAGLRYRSTGLGLRLQGRR